MCVCVCVCELLRLYVDLEPNRTHPNIHNRARSEMYVCVCNVYEVYTENVKSASLFINYSIPTTVLMLLTAI